MFELHEVSHNVLFTSYGASTLSDQFLPLR